MLTILENGKEVSFAPAHEKLEDAVNWIKKYVKPEHWSDYEIWHSAGYRISIRQSYGY